MNEVATSARRPYLEGARIGRAALAEAATKL
jgi:hypothetical protein